VAAGPADLLGALSAVLEKLGCRWYVFGAQAVVAYGTPRMTADVDVTVEWALSDLDTLVVAMDGAGFTSRAADPAAFVATTSVLPFVHTASGMPLDVVFAGSVLEGMFLDGARVVDVGGVSVPMIRPEHLIVTKLLAGRPKDIEDVRGVLAESSDELDIELTQNLLSDIERALDRSDLVTQLQALRTR
jgi:hypothetical protein